MWNCKCDKVKRKIVIQNYENGGLKMVDFNMCIKAAKVKWIKKYLTCQNDTAWKTTFEYLSNLENLALYCMSNFDTCELPKNLPIYFKESLTQWK